MRGTKAKALRREMMALGLNRTEYRRMKRGSHNTDNVVPLGKPVRKRRKPLPVARTAGAKPMHLVRKIIELQVEREMKVGKNDKALYGMMPRYRLLEALVDARDPEWTR